MRLTEMSQSDLDALLFEKEHSEQEIAELKKSIEEANAIIEALKAEVARWNAILDHDGINTGKPASQTHPD